MTFEESIFKENLEKLLREHGYEIVASGSEGVTTDEGKEEYVTVTVKEKI